MRIILLVAICLLCACVVQPKQPPKSVSQFKSENVDLVNLEEKLELLKLRVPTPIFPVKAVNENQQGWCVVSFSVLASGKTENHRVVECSPLGYFENAALGSAKNITAGKPPEEDQNDMYYTYVWNLAK